MTATDTEEVPWAVSDEVINFYFKRVQKWLQPETAEGLFIYSNAVLSEITPNVERSLKKNFVACHKGYSAAKLAGLYSFWTAKLKPGVAPFNTKLPIVNEIAAIALGIGIVKDRLNVDLNISTQEFHAICDTLRYHTSSPHTMMHIYEQWIEREILRIS